MGSTEKHLTEPVARQPAGSGASDLALIKRVQQGDKSAFDLLVIKYQHKILKLIMRYVRDSSEAMDVAQEAFLKAYRAAPSFRGDSAFYTWLYRIAINTAKNHLVAASRRPAHYNLDTQDPEHALARPLERDRDAEERIGVREVRRPVERVDDPAELLAGRRAAGFLAEPAVSREAARELGLDEAFAAPVELGHQVDAAPEDGLAFLGSRSLGRCRSRRIRWGLGRKTPAAEHCRSKQHRAGETSHTHDAVVHIKLPAKNCTCQILGF